MEVHPTEFLFYDFQLLYFVQLKYHCVTSISLTYSTNFKSGHIVGCHEKLINK